MSSTMLQESKMTQDRSFDPAQLPISEAAPSPTNGRSSGSVPAIPALLVDRVTKRFQVARKKRPVTAIADVSVRLERGGTIGILGANGSGKSTLIRLVSGLLTLDEGRVEVFGHDIVREEMAVKRLINRVSVDAAFFKKLSPMENLLFAARLYGIDSKLARRETVRMGQEPTSRHRFNRGGFVGTHRSLRVGREVPVRIVGVKTGDGELERLSWLVQRGDLGADFEADELRRSGHLCDCDCRLPLVGGSDLCKATCHCSHKATCAH